MQAFIFARLKTAILFSIISIVSLVATALATAAPVLLPNTPITDLYDFGSQKGDPGPPTQHSLIAVGKDGALYSTSPSGGTHSLGCIFKMTKDGEIDVLYSFSGKDGVEPWSGLTVGPDGDFYGTTNGGGAHQAGVIFKIGAGGTGFQKLFDFCNGWIDPHTYKGQPSPQQVLDAAGSYPASGPVAGSDGNLYGVVPTGNIQRDGIFYRLTTDGQYKGLCNLKDEKLSYPYAFIPGSGGVFYGTALISSAGRGYAAVFQATTGGQVSVIKQLPPTTGSNPLNITLGSDGNIYGICAIGGSASTGVPRGCVYKLTPGGDLTVLHTFPTLRDGTNPAAGITRGSDGYLYGSTAGIGSNLFRMKPDGSDYTSLFFFNSASGLSPYQALVQLSDGKFYGFTTARGGHWEGTEFCYDPNALIVSSVRWGLPKIQTTNGARNVVQNVYAQGAGKGVVAAHWSLDGKKTAADANQVDLSSGNWTKIATYSQPMTGSHRFQFLMDGDQPPTSSIEQIDITAFIPSVNGWAFDMNSFEYKWESITGQLSGNGSTKSDVSSRGDGACEGFAISARDYFNNHPGLPPRPPGGQQSLAVDQLIYQDFVNGNAWRKVEDANVDNPTTIPQYIADLNEQAPAIQYRIRFGDPVVIDIYPTVVTGGGAPNAHAVLAYASFFATNVYATTGNGSANLIDDMKLFSIYDPNYPGNDNRYVGAFSSAPPGSLPTFQYIPLTASEYLPLKLWIPNTFHTPK